MKEYIMKSSAEIAEAFRGYVDNHAVRDDILIRLARDLGFSFEMYNTLATINQDTANSMVECMSKKSNHPDIAFLANSDEVLGYSLESPRVPLLNEDFMKRTVSLVESCKEIALGEQYLASDDTKSSVIIKKVDPIVVDLNTSQTPYNIGVLLVNNELENVYCRLVVYINDQPFYLPASYYNVSSNRYKKSTGDSAEALEVLVLKVIDDLREEELKYKISDFHLKYRANKDILTTYEEYNTLLRTMMKIPTVIDDSSVLAPLTSKYEDFEQKYAKLADQKSSYIWRCTAIGDLDIGNLVNIISIILNELKAPAMECYDVRELIGSYLSTNRIAVEIAKED